MAMKKILCALLAVLMIVGAFAACTSGGGSSSQESKPAESSSKAEDKSSSSKAEESQPEETSLLNLDSMFPVTNEPVELSILVRLTTDSAEPDDIWFWQYYERKTNVKWDFTTVLDSAWAERKPVMMATGDYPGVILISDAFTNTEVYNNGKEGIFLPLNDLIDQYSTNLKQRFDEFPAAKSVMTCPDGNIYALYKIAPTYLGSPQAALNVEWLEETGLAMPTTLDEFYEVMKAFKELGDVNGDGLDNEYPWGGVWTSSARSFLLDAIGLLSNGNIENGIAIKDNEAVYFPMDEDYLKYLTYANKLYSEKLIEQDCFTMTDEEMVAKGQLGTMGFMGAQARYYTAEGGWEAYNYPIPLVENKGDTPIIFKSSYVSSPSFYITDNCDQPEVAFRWIDIFYDAYESVHAGYGPCRDEADEMLGWEDSYVGWTAVDKPNENMIWTTGDPGTPTYKTLTFADHDGNQFRPADMSTVQLRNMYMLPWASAYIFMMGDEWFYTQMGWAITAYENSLAGTTEAIWRKTFYENASQYQQLGFPSVYFFSDEDNDWIAENLTILTDYAKAEEAKFITGARPLSEFDAYVDQLKALGAEKYQSILHDYYETYKANS